MNTENSAEGQPDTAERIARLESGIAAGQRVQLLLILALGSFVWRSAALQHRTLEGVRLVNSRMQTDLANQRLVIEDFRKYARTHPGFAPILKAKGIDLDTPMVEGAKP